MKFDIDTDVDLLITESFLRFVSDFLSKILQSLTKYKLAKYSDRYQELVIEMSANGEQKSRFGLLRSFTDQF